MITKYDYKPLEDWSKKEKEINLPLLCILLDAAAHCGDRECDECKKMFKTYPLDCPMWLNKENTMAALKAIEFYLDSKYDHDEKVRGDKLVKILLGEENV